MNIESLKDEQLVSLVCFKDQEAYRYLVQRYQDRLLRYVRYLTGNSKEAEDIVQEAFINAYINLKGFDTTKKFSSWIYRIVHNKAVNFLKKKKVVSLEANNWIQEIADSDDGVLSKMEKKERQTLLKIGLNKLPPLHRECIILYYVEEKSYEEISDILKIPIGTVATNLSRGKRHLKELLGKEGFNEQK